MDETAIAKLFWHDGEQAVGLPDEFHMPGKEVQVRRIGRGVLLEPVGEKPDMAAVWAQIDEAQVDGPFLPEGRPEQPPMPVDDRKYFDDE